MFGKLRLEPSHDTNRRVRAVLTLLQANRPDSTG